MNIINKLAESLGMPIVHFEYGKCLNLRPGRLFNFLRREGGANLKGGGGAYFVYQFLASK